MKRICVLLNNDFTVDNRVRREVESLANAGYQVTLLCVKASRSDLPTQEQRGNLDIRRIFAKRLPKYHAWSFRLFKALATVILQFPKFDAVHAHDAQMLPLGRLLSRFWKAKLIYDSHEYWSALFDLERQRLLAEAEGSARKLKRMEKMAAFETRMLSRCDAVISVSPTICRLLQEHSQGRVPQCYLIRNIPEAAHVDKGTLFHQAFQLPNDTKIALYLGQIAEKRGLSYLIEAMALVEKSIVLVLMGSVLPGDRPFFETLMAQVAASPLLKDRVFFKEAVPPEEIMPWAASAELGLSPILNHSLSYYYSLPNKVFEYIQAGLPVGASNFPEIQHLVETYQIGFTFDPEDPQAISEGIRQYFTNSPLQQTYRENIQKAKQALNWEQESQQLLALYAQLFSNG